MDQKVCKLLSFQLVYTRIVVAMGGHLGFELTYYSDKHESSFMYSEIIDLVGIDTLMTALRQTVYELLLSI